MSTSAPKSPPRLFTVEEVAEICFTLFSATPAGSLQKWERRHYVAFIKDQLAKSEK